MKKSFHFSQGMFLALFAVFLIQRKAEVQFWHLFMPFALDFAFLMLKLSFQHSGLEKKFYETLGSIVFKIRAWQIRRQLRK